MKTRTRSAITMVLVTAGLLAGAGAAQAATTPAWEPDASALGAVAFYDADGNQVTGGDLGDHPLAWYTVASGDGRTGDTKAQLRAYTPQEGVNPASWSGDTLTASTDYPNTAAPADIAALTVPVASGSGDDLSLADYIGELPNTSTTDGYAGLYELRLYTSGPGQTPSSAYYRVDIEVSVTGTGSDGLPTGTWTVVYPIA
jgi:hypothetical protein